MDPKKRPVDSKAVHRPDMTANLTNHRLVPQTMELGRHPSYLAPCGHREFSLCLQPIIQIMSVLSASLLEQLVSTNPDVLVIGGLRALGSRIKLVFPVTRLHDGALLP